MSKGDVVVSIQSISTLAYLTYQPAAGVEAMILCAGSEDWIGTAPDGTPNMDILIYDGVSSASVMSYNSESLTWLAGKPTLINNAVYLLLCNPALSAKSLSYSGIQTK